MDNIQAVQFVFDRNSFRIGALFWLATCNDGMAVPDELKEAIEDGDALEAFEPLPDYVDPDNTDEVLGWLLDERKLGFLARVDTPIPVAVHESGYSTRGWGMYTMRWVYAENLDDMLSVAEQASKQTIEKKLAKLRSKAA